MQELGGRNRSSVSMLVLASQTEGSRILLPACHRTGRIAFFFFFFGLDQDKEPMCDGLHLPAFMKEWVIFLWWSLLSGFPMMHITDCFNLYLIENCFIFPGFCGKESLYLLVTLFLIVFSEEQLAPLKLSFTCNFSR